MSEETVAQLLDGYVVGRSAEGSLTYEDGRPEETLVAIVVLEENGEEYLLFYVRENYWNVRTEPQIIRLGEPLRMRFLSADCAFGNVELYGPPHFGSEWLMAWTKALTKAFVNCQVSGTLSVFPEHFPSTLIAA